MSDEQQARDVECPPDCHCRRPSPASLDLDAQQNCDYCDGIGKQPGAELWAAQLPCERCGGNGKAQNQIDALARYDLITNYRAGSSIEEMERSDDGDWVRYEDVVAALQRVRGHQ